MMIGYDHNGTIQFVEEERIDLSMHYFLKLAEERPGLIITRRYPGHIKRMFDLPDMEHHWLTMDHMAKKAIVPTQLSLLANIIMDFLEREPTGVVLLEGLEYLMVQNHFDFLIRFIQYLRDRVASTKGHLIVSIDPLAYDVKQVHLVRLEGTVMSRLYIEGMLAMDVIRPTAAAEGSGYLFD